MTALQAFSADVAELVARAAPAVVGVEHRRGQGSGAVLAQDGYLLTNAHDLQRVLVLTPDAEIAIDVSRGGSRRRLALRPRRARAAA